ncbi:sugar ABC transporter substrate-binding protein [Pseudonocardia sp.]|uniref:sugar ABC transporter substrate-binding protein n=1 Tax=Pseudonocardia sp. TaxID=60912 RepID=UPI003D0B00FD
MRQGSPVGSGKVIASMTNGFNIYTRYLSSGVQKGLEGTGYGYIGRQNGFDSGRELANFEELIELGVDGIVIMPHKLESAARGAELAAKAGIPVVSLLRFGPGPMDEHIVGSVRQDARVADIAEWVTANTEPCEVLLVPSVLGQGFSETYTKTLEDAFERFGGGRWKIVGAAEGHYDRFRARAAVEGLLREHPGAKVVIDYAAEMAIGIAQYLKANDIQDVVTITSDCTEEMIPWVKDGWITASRYYSPAWHGLTGVQVLRDYLENGGKKQLEAVEVPVADVIVTKENIDEWTAKQPVCYEEYFANVVRIP